MQNTRATEWVTFGFSFSILIFHLSKGLNLTVCQQYGPFSVLAVIIRESSDKQLALRIVKALPFIHQPSGAKRRVTYRQLIGYINTCEKIRYVCCYSFSQGR